MKKEILKITIVIQSLIIFSFIASAQNSVSPSGVRYSRLSQVIGDVQLFKSSGLNSIEATVNMPFLQGDRLITGSLGHSEICIDNGSFIWIWNDSKLDVEQLGYSQKADSQVSIFRFWVGQILVKFNQKAHPDSVQCIEFSNFRLETESNSMFFLETQNDGTIQINILDGSAAIHLQSGKYQLSTGFSVTFDPSSEKVQKSHYQINSDFLDWVMDRNKSFIGIGSSASYLPDGYETAARDMDSAGRWTFNANLSTWCWAPYVSMSWVPYRYGFWDFVLGWGWTWIPEEPWGWFVYHYGYWAFFYECGWIWVPHWRWGAHWAAWREYDHAVHWVPLHPRDHLNAAGRLLDGAVPNNSQLKIGIPVETSLSNDAHLHKLLINQNQLNPMTHSGGKWLNNPESPLQLKDNYQQHKKNNDYQPGNSIHSTAPKSMKRYKDHSGQRAVQESGSGGHLKRPDELYWKNRRDQTSNFIPTRNSDRGKSSSMKPILPRIVPQSSLPSSKDAKLLDAIGNALGIVGKASNGTKIGKSIGGINQKSLKGAIKAH